MTENSKYKINERSPTMPKVMAGQQRVDKRNENVEEISKDLSTRIKLALPTSFQHTNHIFGRCNEAQASLMTQSASRKGKPLRNVFDGSISTTEIMTSLEGHGGTSRMFARGK